MQPALSPDEAARHRIRTSLGESLFVEAAAGTGKTTELVRRIVAVLQSGLTTVDKIAAVTFTHKAAGELKLRLRVGLDRTRLKSTDPEVQAHLAHALAHLEEASIGTIHGFCAQILRERPVEACVDPAFGELSELEAGHIRNRAFRAWLEQQLNQDSPALRRAFSRLAHRDSWESGTPVEQLRYAGRTLLEWRDFPAPWDRRIWDREGEIDALVERIRASAPRLAQTVALRPVHDFAAAIDRAELVRRRDYDALESMLLKLRRDLNRGGGKKKGIEDLIGRLEGFRGSADADLAASLRMEMSGLVERYDEAKRKAGKLDFLDLLILARDLVARNTEVREYLQRRYSHIFVDEFQDTDPLQAELLLLLAADNPREGDWRKVTPVPGKLFAVGDPKQSIYKFRRADVLLYSAIRERLEARGVGVVRLGKSHRQTAGIQRLVNAAFEPVMDGSTETGQAAYVPLEGDTPDPDSQPSVVVVPAPDPYGQRSVSKQAINKCLPDAITAFTAWLIQESGWTVRDPERGAAGRVPITPRHVCILFRRFTNFGTDVTREYARGLEARGIPHLLAGSKSFHNREEVETLRTALTAVEWPGDELSVYATLRGPMVAFEDTVLLRYQHEVGRLHPFAPRPPEIATEFAPVANALDLLADLHKMRNWRPVAETVNLLLSNTRAHAGFALRPAGHQVLANVNRIAELARAFELSGGISFRGFVEELEQQSEKAESAEAPVLEEGAEGVRMMTVHAAKGLEFPVVILGDMTANIAATEPERYVDAARGLCATRLLRCAPWELLDHEAMEREREKAEGVRVAYVAATRARDLLVVPAVGDQPLGDTWISPLERAVYPDPMRQRKPSPAPGCPRFGDVTVLSRPPEYLMSGEDPSVKPGQHRPLAGTHNVVWWDPALLIQKLDANYGIRQQTILADGPAAMPGIERYRAWQEARAARIDAGRHPRFDVITPTDGRPLPEGFTCEVDVVMVEHPPNRPTGPRFGSLIHGVMRDVDLAGFPENILAAVQLHARVLGAPEYEVEAAADTVVRVLAHPLIRQAGAAQRMHREWPVMLHLDGGQVLEGQVDLAFFSGGVWQLVDFKTDADLAGGLTRYKTQVQWYAYAIGKLAGAPVRASLMAV
ncbi:MAG: ATP-dependent deoxyribonuclease subunit A [Acidobacteria bacterium]|nr:ATP-dependent deoxyribonuclease subunit A [Acidobacteriota bacterium]